jgi:hypothetical protein
MTDKLLIEILKIVKQNKQTVLDGFKAKRTNVYYVDFEKVFDSIDDYVKKLTQSIVNESNTFNKNYEDEKQMLDAVTKSMQNIDDETKNIINIYVEINSVERRDETEKILALKVLQKILNDYLHWCEELELALMGLNTNEVIFSPNVDNEAKLVSIVSKNTNKDCNLWLPFLGGLGVGYMLGDE